MGFKDAEEAQHAIKEAIEYLKIEKGWTAREIEEFVADNN